MAPRNTEKIVFSSSKLLCCGLTGSFTYVMANKNKITSRLIIRAALFCFSKKISPIKEICINRINIKVTCFNRFLIILNNNLLQTYLKSSKVFFNKKLDAKIRHILSLKQRLKKTLTLERFKKKSYLHLTDCQLK